jgi:hypothetical protein
MTYYRLSIRIVDISILANVLGAQKFIIEIRLLHRLEQTLCDMTPHIIDAVKGLISRTIVSIPNRASGMARMTGVVANGLNDDLAANQFVTLVPPISLLSALNADFCPS